MRKKIVAANWKMNLNLNEGAALVRDVLEGLPPLSSDRFVVIAPTFVHLSQTAVQLAGRHHIYLGAQNCHTHSSGAYTGEVAAPILKSAGVLFVILGHSERREYFHESDSMVAAKTEQALAAGLKVIFCCGEPLAIRDGGTELAFVEAQVRAGLFHLTPEQLGHITIAYEPIWAIGTGRTAAATQAQHMHAHIRKVVGGHFGDIAAANTSILYGGSCKPSNAAELFACPDVDGGLIGGASLKAEEFLAIINAM